MLFTEIIAITSEIQIKPINTFHRPYAALLNVKADGTYSYHCGIRVKFDTNICNKGHPVFVL